MLIPKEVKNVVGKLQKNGFEAYIVGGCVRDFLLARRSKSEGGLEQEPQDWDITTNAKPEEIRKIFPKSFYENKFLTVTVQTGSKNQRLSEIEITTYRLETKYTDKRHPDEVRFAKTLEEDLARRDFTINAIALEIFSTPNTKHLTPKIIDPFNGQKDLKDKIIKTVGNPDDRFSEDALRMIRAIRFATTLGFTIEEKTASAIKKNAVWLKAISKERIRDEFLKIIMSDRPEEGIELLRESGLLQFIAPELLESYKITQNKHHIYDCWEHSLFSLKYTAQKKFNQNVRLAALFHDIGKPRVKRGEGLDSTFYNHEIVGARMTKEILETLKFSKKDIDKVVRLVRYHLFYYNAGEVTDSSVRRLVRNVGPENMEELLQVRQADRIGSGVPKAEPYKLRHLKYVVEKVSRDPISAKMLKVNGNDIMKLLEIKPGPKIGQILDILLGMVLLDPKKNKKDFLEKEVKKLAKLSEKELSSLAQGAKKEREEIETKEDKMTKQKYWVT
jgi:poly(A) polymerase/tRNA nucleotidyltransferase (CCA-adding enzyme)